MPADRQAGQDRADNMTVRQMTGTRAFQVEEDDIASELPTFHAPIAVM